MKHVIAIATLCSSLLFCGAASAAIIQITDVTGVWIDTTPDAPEVTGVGTNSIRWGNPVYYGYKSGYDFNSYTPPNINVTPGAGFLLGEFIHYNYPITGSTLENAELKVTTTVDFDGVSKTLDSIFQFNHWETVNNPGRYQDCANGESRYSYINSFGCADQVTFALNERSSTTYTIGNQEYYLDIAGFLFDGVLADEFWTKEKKDNEAVLAGVIRSNTIEVPEPSTLALLGLGLLGFGARRFATK